MTRPAQTTILDLSRLDGKTALATGAVQDIGSEIERGLSRAGAKAVVADMNAELGKAAAGTVRNTPAEDASGDWRAGTHLTRSLVGEWAGRGVRVNAVAPGHIDTPMMVPGLETPGWRGVWLKETPVGRTAEPAEITEIAPAVPYLARGVASFVTGHTLVTDGRFTAW